MITPASKATVVKGFLFGLLLLLLSLPALQARFGFAVIPPLDGYFERVSPPEAATWSNLLSSRYQEQMERYLNDQLGFREWFIRLRNQVDYSLFKKLHATDTVLGKNGVLFQGAHIKSYLGDDFLGEDEIKFYARRLRTIQDDLARQGTQLLCVLAPGKPRYQPEDLPRTAQEAWVNKANYPVFAREFAANGVHTLDAVQLFQHWKKTAAYPLFPRGGTHWSGYSITLVADTLFRQLEHLGNYDLPNFRSLPGVVTTTDLRFTDADIAKALNLLRDPAPYPMAYPEVVFEPLKGNQRRANVLLIGDSFTQSFSGFYHHLDHLLDGRSRFWYYNETTFWPDSLPASEERNVHKLNLREQLQGRDAVVLVATEQNMNRYGFGFIDEAYHLFHPYTAADTVRLEQLKQDIMRIPSWAEKVHKHAEDAHIAPEEALAKEAHYMRERER